MAMIPCVIPNFPMSISTSNPGFRVYPTYIQPLQALAPFTTDQIEEELFCAQILAELDVPKEFGIRLPPMKTMQPGFMDWRNSKITKNTLKTKPNGTSKIGRNVNACDQHKKRHQRCPLDCPRRLKRDKKTEPQVNSDPESQDEDLNTSTHWAKLIAHPTMGAAPSC